MGISSSLGSSALLPAGLGFRNLIINGAMQVSQRSAVGTAVTGITTTNYYTADRWQTDINALGTFSQTTIADAPTGSGFRNSVKLQCTTADASPAASDYLLFRQKFEGQNLQAIRKGTSSAQTVTLSFWVKAFQTGTFIVELYDNTNNRSCNRAYTINASNTWEYKTLTFPADVTGELSNDSSLSFIASFWLGAGTTYTSGTLQTTWATTVSANRAVGVTNLASSTNNAWQITGVQLEANLQPTPFEHRPIGIELALCQRYYYRIFPNATLKILGTYCFSINTSTAQAYGCFPVPMRVAPTALEQSGTASNYSVSLPGTVNNSLTSVPTFSTVTTSTEWGVTVGTSAVLGAHNPYSFRTDPTTGANAFLGWSAEL
jgi:hypothetical protein